LVDDDIDGAQQAAQMPKAYREKGLASSPIRAPMARNIAKNGRIIARDSAGNDEKLATQ
jgi:hypothetical protein